MTSKELEIIIDELKDGACPPEGKQRKQCNDCGECWRKFFKDLVEVKEID